MLKKPNFRLFLFFCHKTVTKTDLVYEGDYYNQSSKKGVAKMKIKKMLKRIVLIALSLFTALNGAAVCNAAVKNEEIAPYYVNISSSSASLNISGIKATCNAVLRANSSVSLSIKMELQKKKSSGYETVETWTSSKTGTYLSMSESRNINILCDYRLKVTFTAGSETEVVYRY